MRLTEGNSMRLTLTVLALAASVQGSFAKEPECRGIDDTAARLSCYDAAYPRKSAKPATDPDNLARAPYRDPFLAEDARTNARLKNICRGC
jgi:hypothetical protein